jgi:hypothetical protein
MNLDEEKPKINRSEPIKEQKTHYEIKHRTVVVSRFQM